MRGDRSRFVWLRRYWNSLLLAAAFSYGQLHDTGGTDVRAAQRHPYVWMLPDEPSGMDPREVVDGQVLTEPLDLTRDQVWN